MAKEIIKISTASMSNGAHYNFMQSTLERSKANETVQEKAKGEIDALEAALARENENLKVATKSELTAGISEGDTRRDSYYTGYKTTVKGFTYLPAGEAMKAAADRLWSHIANYAINTQAQLDKQTGMMTNFIEDLEKELAADVTALGLTLFVTSMKGANEQVRTLMMQRDAAKGAKTVGATKADRALTDEAYDALVRKVNALAVVEGDEKYASFIDEMNGQNVRYKREVLGQKADMPSSSGSSGGGSGSGEEEAG